LLGKNEKYLEKIERAGVKKFAARQPAKRNGGKKKANTYEAVKKHHYMSWVKGEEQKPKGTAPA